MILEKVNYPEDLKCLKIEDKEQLAEEIREKIINTVSETGGHLASNLGVVELTIALHSVFNTPIDKIIWDVGHQTYVHKILTGRKNKLDTLRKMDGIAGFRKTNESIYDNFNTGHSSTSISVALGMARARDIKGENNKILAVIGDGALTGGMALEALNDVGSSNTNMIVILNDNEMSISKNVGGISMMLSKLRTKSTYVKANIKGKRTISRIPFVGNKIVKLVQRGKRGIKQLVIPKMYFEDIGFRYLGPVDGHNIEALEDIFNICKHQEGPILVHILTKKGKGYKPAENDQTGYWHGVTPFEIETGIPKNMHEGYASWSHIYSDITIREMEANEKLFLISPATIKGAGLDEAFEKFKNRTLDVGISEEHAVTLASGLCLNSYHPIISIYSTFLQRSYDEIIHDLARINANVTFLIERSGLIGEDGETHQGIYDVAFLRTIPNTTITMASTINEANKLYKLSLDNNGPFFIRIPRTITKLDENYKDEEILLNSWLHLKKDNSKVAVVGVGPLLRELETLINEEQINCNIFNALFLNKIDNLTLNKLLEMETIFIYDPYSTELGLVDFLRSELYKNGFKGRLFSRCVENEFVTKATKNAQLEKYQLLPSQMVAFIKQNII